MTEPERRTSGEQEAIPPGQRLYDRPFLLLAAGVLIMVLVYTAWGLWEVLTLPPATLP